MPCLLYPAASYRTAPSLTCHTPPHRTTSYRTKPSLACPTELHHAVLGHARPAEPDQALPNVSMLSLTCRRCQTVPGQSRPAARCPTGQPLLTQPDLATPHLTCQGESCHALSGLTTPAVPHCTLSSFTIPRRTSQIMPSPAVQRTTMASHTGDATPHATKP